MGVTVFNIPVQISEMVRYTEYLTKISKSELYRKAISYFIENGMRVTDQVLYMPLTDKPYKEQVYIDSCKAALNEYRMKLQQECGEGVFPISGKGIMQKKNRYRNSTIMLQAIIQYLYFLYAEQDTEEEPIIKGLNYMKEYELVWNENKS